MTAPQDPETPNLHKRGARLAPTKD